MSFVSHHGLFPNIIAHILCFSQCDYCLTGNKSTRLGPGSPEAFVSDIETAVELVRQNIRK